MYYIFHTTVDEFVDVGFAVMDRKPSREQREALFHRMISNSKTLSEMGVMVSAETMLNKRTIPHLAKIHKQVVEEMGCTRHEIHPMYDSGFAKSAFSESQDPLHQMYPADFASALESASLADTRQPSMTYSTSVTRTYGCCSGRCHSMHVLTYLKIVPC